jgi:hypothetical protein
VTKKKRNRDGLRGTEDGVTGLNARRRIVDLAKELSGKLTLPRDTADSHIVKRLAVTNQIRRFRELDEILADESDDQ